MQIGNFNHKSYFQLFNEQNGPPAELSERKSSSSQNTGFVSGFTLRTEARSVRLRQTPRGAPASAARLAPRRAQSGELTPSQPSLGPRPHAWYTKARLSAAFRACIWKHTSGFARQLHWQQLLTRGPGVSSGSSRSAPLPLPQAGGRGKRASWGHDCWLPRRTTSVTTGRQMNWQMATGRVPPASVLPAFTCSNPSCPFPGHGAPTQLLPLTNHPLAWDSLCSCWPRVAEKDTLNLTCSVF